MKKNICRLFLTGCAAALMLSCTGNSGNSQQQPVAPAAPATQEQPAQPATVDSTQTQAAPAAATTAVPDPVNAFIKQYFPDAAIARVETDTEHGGVEYDVYLNDGTEIDFDTSNRWDKVDCRTKPVPAALVPQAIANYVKSNYASMSIIKIDKDFNGYDIELSNGLDLEFDGAGRFMRIDD